MNDYTLENELSKVAPEAHRNYMPGHNKLWCPWAYKDVIVSSNYRGWPICSGCLRPVNLEVAKTSR